MACDVASVLLIDALFDPKDGGGHDHLFEVLAPIGHQTVDLEQGID